MAIEIGELRGVLTLSDQFSAPVEGISKKLGNLGQSFTAVGQFAGLTVGAVGAVGGAILALGNRGSAVDDISTAFAGLTTHAGGADAVLEKMRAGVLGTTSDFDLMTQANKALGAGLNLSADDMGTLAAGAKMLADRTGKDTLQAMDALSRAMITGRTTSLEPFAFSVGKGGDILGALRAQLAAAGPQSRDFTDNIEAGKTGVKNFTDALSLAIATSPALAAGMQSIMVGVDQAFGSDRKALVETLTGYVNDFAIGVTYVGQAALVAGQVLVTAWYGAKTAIGAVLTVVAGVAGGLLNLVAMATSVASSLPGLGDKFAGLSEKMKGAADFTVELTKGFAAETAENAKATLGHNAASQTLEKMIGVLFNGRTALRDAKDATVEATKATDQFGVSQGAAAAKVEEAAGKIREYMTKLQMDLAISQATGLQQRLLQNQTALDQELAQLAAKDGLDAEQRAVAEELIRAHYARKAEIITASGDEILEYETKLEENLAILRATGYEQKVLQLQQEEADEIASLEARALTNQEQHDRLLARLREFYAEKRRLLEESTRGENEQDTLSTEEKIGNLNKWASAAGRSTGGVMGTQIGAITALGDAWKRLEEAKSVWAQLSGKVQAQVALDVAGATVGAMRALWPKSKGLAIASIVIDTARGAMAAWASAPNPIVGAILAAIVVAAGAMQIAKVKSTNPGFRFGTQDLGYQDFGRVSIAALHGPEAIVPKAKVGDFALDVADKLEGFWGGESDRGEIVIHNVINLDGQKVAENQVRHIPRVLALAGVGF